METGFTCFVVAFLRVLLLHYFLEKTDSQILVCEGTSKSLALSHELSHLRGYPYYQDPEQDST